MFVATAILTVSVSRVSAASWWTVTSLQLRGESDSTELTRCRVTKRPNLGSEAEININLYMISPMSKILTITGQNWGWSWLSWSKKNSTEFIVSDLSISTSSLLRWTLHTNSDIDIFGSVSTAFIPLKNRHSCDLAHDAVECCEIIENLVNKSNIWRLIRCIIKSKIYCKPRVFFIVRMKQVICFPICSHLCTIMMKSTASCSCRLYTKNALDKVNNSETIDSLLTIVIMCLKTARFFTL